MTLKAVRIIKECPVIAAPRTKNGNMIALSIAGQVVDMTEKTVIPLDFPMKQDNTAQHENHCRIAEQLAVYLGNGQDRNAEYRRIALFIVYIHSRRACENGI